MGHHQQKEDSSSGEDGSEEKETEEKENVAPPAKASKAADEIKFGEQLQDDLMNSFSDKLQAVCPKKLEALLAIQFLMISDVADVKKHVSGKRDAMNILYDQTRMHYVLVHFDPKYNHVVLYDSLQPFESDGQPKIISEIFTQIAHLFGHLYGEYITIMIDSEYQMQADSFSCGYRTIAALVELARGRNPARLIYGRAAILDFMRSVLAEPKPTWQMFEQARLSKVSKDYTGDKRWRVLVPNPAWTGTSKSRSSSASRVSSRASSTTSLNVLEKRLPAGSSSMQVDDTVATAASASFPTSSSPLTLNTRLDPPSDYMSQMYCTLTRHFSIWKSSVFSKK